MATAASQYTVAVCSSVQLFTVYVNWVFLLCSRRGAKYCDLCIHLCGSACPLAYLKHHMSKIHKIFYTCYLWP